MAPKTEMSSLSVTVDIDRYTHPLRTAIQHNQSEEQLSGYEASPETETPPPATPLDSEDTIKRSRPLPRPSGLHQRKSSGIVNLSLDSEKDKRRFGLAYITIATSTGSPTDPFEYDLITPRAPAMEGLEPSKALPNGDRASQQASPSVPSPNIMAAPSVNLPSRSTPTNIPSASSSRIRHPPPPSPLSKVSSPTEHGVDPGPPSPGVTLSPPAMPEPLTSPCYIHSYLDRHGSGSLVDYLSAKDASHSPSKRSPQTMASIHAMANGSGTPSTARPQHHVHQSAKHPPHIPHPAHTPSASHHTSHPAPTSPRQQQHHYNGPQAGTSPKRSTSRLMSAASVGNMSGYESDRSSLNGFGSGSALFDGEYDEEGGSLTRQLAETAQGVREMSKELGRTRVRSRISSVLIVTKARDNRLIRLTRELAVYLMKKRTNTAQSDPPKSSDSQSSHFSTSTNTASNNDRGMVVYVDSQLRHSKRFDTDGLRQEYPEFFKPVLRRRSSSSNSLSTISAYPSTTSMAESMKRRTEQGQLRFWTSEMCSNSPHLFDFVITLGGDGTVLFTSWLFQKIVPPVLPFALGSLGFLTNFDFASYSQTMDRVIDDGIRVNLRMRFTCTVYRAVAPEDAEREAAAAGVKGKRRKAIKRAGGEILMSQVDKGGWDALEGPANGPICQPKPGCEGKDKEIMCYTTRPVEQFEVLNDLVVDRGPSPYVSLLELFGDEHHLTTVQADGLTISTPTGSTAYSLSAGGSLAHPQIPALLITPICPHTLSFRPMLLPDSLELRVCVPYNSRSTAWASFDGRGRVELKQGDHIKVTASKYPFPTVCADKASTDWFNAVSRTLRWNEREKQKSFVVVEEDHAAPPDGVRDVKQLEKNKDIAEKGNDICPRPAQKAAREAHEEEEEDEEDDDAYDIDDASAGEATPLSPRSPPEPAASSTQPNSSRRHPLDHKSGVDTPDRFFTHYAGPPPLSQRHLVQKLAGVELKEKENEQGQRDEIRSDDKAFRVKSGESAIPTLSQRYQGPSLPQHHHHHHHYHHQHRAERDKNGSTADQSSAGNPPEVLPVGQRHARIEPSVHDSSKRGRQKPLQPIEGQHSTHQRRDGSQSGKAKAFAFFGQDDSASDMSDDYAE